MLRFTINTDYLKVALAVIIEYIYLIWELYMPYTDFAIACEEKAAGAIFKSHPPKVCPEGEIIFAL